MYQSVQHLVFILPNDTKRTVYDRNIHTRIVNGRFYKDSFIAH